MRRQPREPLESLRSFGCAEADEIVFAQHLLLTQFAKPAVDNLLFEFFLAGADVAHHPVAAFAGDAMKIDQHDCAASASEFWTR